MKRAQIHAPGEVRLDEVPEPEVGPRDVLLEVAACGICGSDVSWVKMGGLAGPGPEPMPLGHELAGTVVEVGSAVPDVVVGTRVALNPGANGYAIGSGGPEGGFAPRLLVREAAGGGCLFPIPDEMSFEHAALAEPLGVGMNAVNRSGAQPGDRVAIFGAGPIGLAALATLLDRGFEDVVSIDLSETRLEVARKLGVPHTVHAGSEDAWARLSALHGTVPFYGQDLAETDVFIEASGARPVLEQIIERARPEARVSVVALHYQPVPVNFITVMMKQLTLQGAMEYPERYEDMLELLGRRDLGPIITHRFPLARFEDALEIARNPDAGAKVMIEVD